MVIFQGYETQLEIFSSKFMTSENLIRLLPLFRSRWTFPVIKIYMVWLTRAGWPNFWAAYQNTQTAESYQSSHLSEGCGKGRPRSRSFAEVPPPRCPGLSMRWAPGVTSGVGQSCPPRPPSLSPAALVLHQPQPLVTWHNLRGRAALKLFAVMYRLKATRRPFSPQCELSLIAQDL